LRSILPMYNFQPYSSRFSFYRPGHPLDLLSFPTRRSSDLSPGPRVATSTSSSAGRRAPSVSPSSSSPRGHSLMASTRWGGDPLPIGNQAALVPADLKRLADSMDGRTVHVALDAADRDARFVSLPKGALVTTPDADKAVWMKLADGVNSWSLVANDTGWVTSGFSTASGWAINECRVRVVNGWAALEIYVNRTGADITMS